MPALETLELSISVSPSSERSLTSFVTDHAHCFAQTLWARYTEHPQTNNLKVFNHHFWSWKPPPQHPDERSFTCGIMKNNIVFESIMKKTQLVIKARDDQKVITTFYNKVWDSRLHVNDSQERLLTFVPTHQHQRQRSHI
jgi:hypothetical protein